MLYQLVALARGGVVAISFIPGIRQPWSGFPELRRGDLRNYGEVVRVKGIREQEAIEVYCVLMLKTDGVVKT